MTRETKDELLLMMLFFGFRRLSGSLLGVAASATFPCPKPGVFEDTLSSSLDQSMDSLPSLSLSLMLGAFRSVEPLDAPVT
jgi:hypothetical protein